MDVKPINLFFLKIQPEQLLLATFLQINIPD